MIKAPFIFSAKRSPIGAFQGILSSLKAPEIAAAVIKNMTPSFVIDEVILGCVLTAGIGQAPARQAVRFSGLPDATSATTLNKVCGSGMKSVMIAADQLALGHAHHMLAGGMESMSQAPYFLSKGRGGYRMGHGEIFDHMMFDGLEDGYGDGQKPFRQPMGCFAEATAHHYGFTRAQQEEFVRQTYEAYQKALASNAFQNEIVPITLGDMPMTQDEPPTRVKPEKFEKLRPAFQEGGTVTAATSSSIADGAAVLHLATEDYAKNEKPLARIVGYVSYAKEPRWFTTAPVGAIQKLLDRTKWSVDDVDLFEINEAFAVVPMATMKELHIPREKVNIHGGACVLGHPIGVSGARILVTLIHALKRHGLKKGIAAACIGGGEATAMAIELV